MSVLVFMRIKTDPASLERVAAENGEKMRAVSEQGRSLGAKHHCFVEIDGDVMVVDEWDSVESFQGFFESNQDIPELMAQGGAQGPPEITFHRVLDTPDAF